MSGDIPWAGAAHSVGVTGTVHRRRGALAAGRPEQPVRSSVAPMLRPDRTLHTWIGLGGIIDGETMP